MGGRDGPSEDTGEPPPGPQRAGPPPGAQAPPVACARLRLTRPQAEGGGMCVLTARATQTSHQPFRAVSPSQGVGTQPRAEGERTHALRRESTNKLSEGNISFSRIHPRSCSVLRPGRKCRLAPGRAPPTAPQAPLQPSQVLGLPGLWSHMQGRGAGGGGAVPGPAGISDSDLVGPQAEEAAPSLWTGTPSVTKPITCQPSPELCSR